MRKLYITLKTTQKLLVYANNDADIENVMENLDCTIVDTTETADIADWDYVDFNWEVTDTE